MVNAHCRAAESVKRAVRCGVDVIYHCEHADEEALDMLEAVKDRVFVGPAIGLLHAAVHEAPEGALHAGVRHGIELGLAAASRAYPEMQKRGIRVVIGGDYGFARTPQGENARDIEHFVRHSVTPSDALVCATRHGAELMGMGNEAGLVREGFLADLLLVDGDPVADVSVLQHKDRLAAICKGGTSTSSIGLPWSVGRCGQRSRHTGSSFVYGTTALPGIAVLCISIDVAGAS